MQFFLYLTVIVSFLGENMCLYPKTGLQRKTAAVTKNFTLCLEYVIHWPIMPRLHASTWRSRVCFSWTWGIRLRDVLKAVWPLAFISEIQFFSWLCSLIWKPPFRATIVLQMLWFTNGYGILQDQTSQKNKQKLKLLAKKGTVTKKKCLSLAC